ncbi:MAG TPA: hypothetical protein VEA63_07780, partial [Opitutus sp.]|nr:hypothetical protein [Opitutus sp.]
MRGGITCVETGRCSRLGKGTNGECGGTKQGKLLWGELRESRGEPRDFWAIGWAQALAERENHVGDLLDDFEAVAARHVDVEKHDVGLLATNC